MVVVLMENETITLNKKIFMDIIKDLQLMQESLELMANREFMNSYKQAKKEIEEGDLIDFNDL